MRILLVCLLLPLTAGAQQLEWSNARKLKGTTVFTRILGENKDGIFLLRNKTSLFSKQMIFEHYSTHLSIQSSKSIPLRREKLVSSTVNENGIVVFTTRYNKITAKNELSAYYLDKDFNRTREPVVVDDAPITDFYDRGDFTVRYSVENKRILVFHTEKTRDKKIIINLAILNMDLERIVKQKISLPFDYQDVGINDLKIDDSGNVFLLLAHQTRQGRRSDDVEIVHGLYCYYPGEDRLEDFQLNDSSTFLIYPHISIDRENNKVNVTAFYSHTYFKSFTGVYNFSYPFAERAEPEVYFTELPSDLISALIGTVRMKRGVEVSDFQILKVVPTSSGGLVLVAERASVSADEDIMIISGVAQTMTRNIYNYDDVLILAMSPEGGLIWYHVINKSQSSMNDGGYFGSVIVGVTPASVHVIYNDKMRGNGDIMQYSIDGKGDITSKILLRSDRNYISVIPSEARQIGANELLLPTMRDKKFALLKLVYEK